MLVANWKMNGSKSLLLEWIEVIGSSLGGDEEQNLIFCPPACYLSIASDLINKRNLNIKLGAQDIDPNLETSLTGGINGSMLRDLGCKYVIIGHSERRIFYKEDDKLILSKLNSASSENLHIIYCIGETQKEKETGQTFLSLKRQLDVIAESSARNYSIAYEPVWAIGSGQVAEFTYIEEIHSKIKEEVKTFKTRESFQILYGGSVDSDSALAILSLDKVDGLLIGGASLNQKEFSQILLKTLNK